MADKLWKQVERRVAHLLCGTRNPLSGINSKHTGADIIHPHLFVEVKSRFRIPFMKTYMDTKHAAHKENKIPMVIFKEKNTKSHIVMIDINDFRKVVDEGLLYGKES